MFAYSPRTENRAGEIYMEGQLASAEMLAAAARQAAEMRANAMLQSQVVLANTAARQI